MIGFSVGLFSLFFLVAAVELAWWHGRRSAFRSLAESACLRALERYPQAAQTEKSRCLLRLRRKRAAIEIAGREVMRGGMGIEYARKAKAS